MAEELLRLAAAYWDASRGSRALVCLNESHANGWRVPAQAAFVTLGLEGSGHHLLEQMRPSLCGNQKKCGGQLSFSYCGGCKDDPKHAWRVFANASPANPDMASLVRQIAPPTSPTAGKFVVIVRDPLDAFCSALRPLLACTRPGGHARARAAGF